jgi:hypothetical protein
MMKTFDDSFDAVVWLGMTEVFGRIFQYPVNLATTGQQLVEIQRLAAEKGTAAQMAKAWETLQAAVGSPFMYEFLATPDFRRVCPTPASAPPAPPMDDVLTVWTAADGKRVVAKDKKTHYLFVVE